MNINVAYWGNAFGSREDMGNPDKNIRAGTAMLGMLYGHLPAGYNDVASVATVYNNLNANKVSDYGSRVSHIYSEFKEQQGGQGR